MRMLAPAAARTSAMCFPSPCEPPVIQAVLSFSENNCSSMGEGRPKRCVKSRACSGEGRGGFRFWVTGRLQGTSGLCRTDQNERRFVRIDSLASQVAVFCKNERLLSLCRVCALWVCVAKLRNTLLISKKCQALRLSRCPFPTHFPRTNRTYGENFGS